jgi:hypothetical protein
MYYQLKFILVCSPIMLSNFLTTFHVVVFQIKIVQSFDPETIQTPSELNASALIEALLNLTKNK